MASATEVADVLQHAMLMMKNMLERCWCHELGVYVTHRIATWVYRKIA